MRKSRGRFLLQISFVFCMLLTSVIPMTTLTISANTSALASNTSQNGFESHPNDKVIEMTSNLNSTLAITQNTTIVMRASASINVTSGNAIKVSDGVTLTIVLNGFTLDVKTSATSMAGIRLPRNSKLIVKEGTAINGVLNVQGGPGTAPENGKSGNDAGHSIGGVGGSGGNGGSAPGAGIGGNGTSGGIGSTSGGYSDRAPGENTHRNGTSGGSGGASTAASSDTYCGDVFTFGLITLNATAGKHILSSITSRSNGGERFYDGRGILATGGGAGGAGGSAYGSAGIGGGGIGGAGGGAGGGGAAAWRSNSNYSGGSGAGGGGGGAGQTGGLGGAGSWGEGNVYPRGNDGSAHLGGTGGVHSFNSVLNHVEAGNGGNGGTVPSLVTIADLGKLYVDTNATLTDNTSENSSINSESNAKLTNKLYLLSECIIEVADANLVYDGTAKKPDIILKDKAGNVLPLVNNTHYNLEYSNNIDAGEKTATIKIKSNGLMTDPNYLLVDGGEYTMKFSIQQNTEPLVVRKLTQSSTFTYGESFNAIVDKHTTNNGKIEWTSTLDDAYQAEITAQPNATTEIIPTKVGKLKLKVVIRQTEKNANGVYNFPEVMSAQLADDITINAKNIDDPSISVPSIGPYTYIGGQIKPTFSDTAHQSGPIKFTTNKDSANTTLVEGKDFELDYAENTSVSTGGKVTIRGIGNYSNTRTPMSFVIEPRSINDSAISVSVNNPTYTGNDLLETPVITIHDTIFNTNYEVPATDFDLEYASKKADNNFTGIDFRNVGEKQVKITGKGNLKDDRKEKYNIVQADIATINLGIERAKDVYFDGREIESRPTIQYYDYLLTEKGTTSGNGGNVDVPNPDDYEIAFSNHKEVGEVTTTITGINNFKGTKQLVGSNGNGYNVLPRPLYILPDANQWKYYGANDIFGVEQNQQTPSYRVFTRALNDAATEEKKDANLDKDKEYRNYVSNNLPIINYPIQLLGNLSREGADTPLLDTRDTTYKYTLNSLKLDDATKANYKVVLVTNESSYKVKSYLYDGDPANIVGTLGKNDWYVKTPVIFNAPKDCTISKSDSLDTGLNAFLPKITFEDGDYSKNGVTYFVRFHNPNDASDPRNGAISNGITHKYKQDTQNPTGNLLILNDAWSVYNENVGFDYFLNCDAIALITGKDTMSELNTKHYFMSDVKLGKDELDHIKLPQLGADSDLLEEGIPSIFTDKMWIAESQFTMKIDEYNTKRKFVYARLEDNAGNVTYINSDGVVFDKDAPILKAEYKQENTWTTDSEVKITGQVYDENAGLKERYVAYQIDDGAMQIIEGIENGSFVIENLQDGNYNLTISAWDKANNAAAPIVFKVMKDTVVPRILLHADTTSIATQQAITFDPKVGASGVSKLEVSYNGGAFQEVQDGVDRPYIATKNGVYTFRITNGANVVSKESSIEFSKIDSKAPIIEMKVMDLSGREIQENEFTNSDIQLFFKNAQNNLGDSIFEYSLDDKATWVEVNENLDNEALEKIVLSEAYYTVHVRIRAKNGLMSEKAFAFGVDRTAPKMNITVADANVNVIRAIIDFIFANKPQAVSANAVDEGSVVSQIEKVQYFVVEGKAALQTLPSDAKGIEKLVQDKWQEGISCEVDKNSTYIVYFKVKDHAGNVSYGRSDRIVIDEAAPELDITYHKAGKWDNQPSIEIYAFDASPGIDKVTYSIDGQPAVTIPQEYTLDSLNLVNGEHTITFKAVDLSGNETIRPVLVKVDNGKPMIGVNPLSGDHISVPIEIDASYNGPSGLDKILVSKNGQPFEDISDLIARGENYEAKENGEYIFRAVSGAGVYSEATTSINQFVASEFDIEAVVSAKTADDKDYENNTWTNQDVIVTFSNRIANLNGLSYMYRMNGGNWEIANATNGYLSIPVTQQGTTTLDFKVIYTQTNKASNVASIKVKIDKEAPNAEMKIDNIAWSGDQYIENGFVYDTYFKEAKYAKVEANDALSDIASYEIFMMKEKDIPSSIKGQTTATKIENLGKDRWVNGSSIQLNPNDKYVAFAKVYDHAGNVSYVSSNGVVFDDINPTLESDINQNDWYNDNISDIHFMVNDELSSIDKVEYRINDANVENAVLDYGEFKINTASLIDGNNRIRVSVYDKAGNVTEGLYAAKKDAIIPKIEVINHVDNGILVSKNALELNVTSGVSGVKKVEVKTPDAGSWTDISDTYQNGFVAEEKGTYWFRVVSGSNNSSTTQITLNNISKDIPVITYMMSTQSGKDYFEGNWSKENVHVQFTNENANQVVAKYMYQVDDGPFVELHEQKDNSAMFTSEEGSHIYTLKLILDNGLESEPVKIAIKVDAIAPTIRVNSDLSKWVKEEQELEVEVIDLESGVNTKGYSFDNGNTWQAENKEIMTANKIVGLKAKDAVDNMASEKW